MKKRIQEHRNDLRYHRTSNSLVIHAEQQNHLPDFEKAEILHAGQEKRMRKMTEAAYITTSASSSHREEFFSLATTTARLILDSLKHEKRPPTAASDSPDDVPNCAVALPTTANTNRTRRLHHPYQDQTPG